MKQRAWAWLGVASALAACSSEAPPDAGGAGSAGGGSAGSAPSSAGSVSAGAGGSTNTAGNVGVSGGSGSSGAHAGGGSDSPSAGASGGGGATAAGAGGASGAATLPHRVLLYHFGTLAIPSLPAQILLLKSQLETWGYAVEDSVKPEDLSPTNLARFGGVGMINTCFEPFGVGKTGEAQTAALKSFVENGGGLFGTHCATVTFQAAEPPNPYNGVIGGRGGHGFFDGKSACRTTEAHPTTLQLPAAFDYTGNLDNADYLADDAHVLVKCKWSGGEQKDTAVSWYRTPGKGRVFYTNFAKIDADLSDPSLGPPHVLLGLGWALGR